MPASRCRRGITSPPSTTAAGQSSTPEPRLLRHRITSRRTSQVWPAAVSPTARSLRREPPTHRTRQAVTPAISQAARFPRTRMHGIRVTAERTAGWMSRSLPHEVTDPAGAVSPHGCGVVGRTLRVKRTGPSARPLLAAWQASWIRRSRADDRGLRETERIGAWMVAVQLAALAPGRWPGLAHRAPGRRGQAAICPWRSRRRPR